MAADPAREMQSEKLLAALSDADIAAQLAARDARIAELEAQVQHYRSREETFIAALAPVCDGGRYRADIVSRIKVVLAERDRLAGRVGEQGCGCRAIVETEARECGMALTFSAELLRRVADKLPAPAQGELAALRELAEAARTVLVPGEAWSRVWNVLHDKLAALDAARGDTARGK